MQIKFFQMGMVDPHVDKPSWEKKLETQINEWVARERVRVIHMYPAIFTTENYVPMMVVSVVYRSAKK